MKMSWKDDTIVEESESESEEEEIDDHFVARRISLVRIIEPGNEIYGHYFCRKIKYDSARDITGVASHGKHARATEPVKKLENKKFSVTPCMLTMTLLPERMMVHVHYLAHNRL